MKSSERETTTQGKGKKKKTIERKNKKLSWLKKIILERKGSHRQHFWTVWLQFASRAVIKLLFNGGFKLQFFTENHGVRGLKRCSWECMASLKNICIKS